VEVDRQCEDFLLHDEFSTAMYSGARVTSFAHFKNRAANQFYNFT